MFSRPGLSQFHEIKIESCGLQEAVRLQDGHSILHFDGRFSSASRDSMNRCSGKCLPDLTITPGPVGDGW